MPAPVSSATYDAANRVETFDGFVVDDDANGNITAIDGDTYAWNVRDELIGITGPGLSASFGYDAFGRRSTKTINGQTTHYLTDGINPLQEQASAGGPWTALTMTGAGVDEIIARGDASGTYYYLPDGLGSTVALMDGAGAIHTEYTYAPFGETTRTGTVSTNPFQFTGRENDNTGLYYYRARYYHPVLQRFISEDPIGFAGGDVNLYGYARNNPLNLRDPLGLATLQLGLIVNVQAGSFAFNYAGGIIIDDRGNVGIYNTPGFATGAGFSASIGVQVQTSNAATIKDVEGPFVTYSATGGEIVNGSVDAFAGPSEHGMVLGGGATAGVGFGLGCSSGATTTTVTPLSGYVEDPSNPTGEVQLQMP